MFLIPMLNAITSGCTMPKNTAPLPDWELVLSSAARLQRILPEAVLVGGTNAVPYDLEETELSEYKSLHPRWHEWDAVKVACSHIAIVIFDRVCDLEADQHSLT
jgi:hypothetical protein